ncbi:periplasmic chaperone for outer membrane proteins Skp [Neolewinella agarilytica]|uniref:Periplasmic chaperone for outer membrane proteins Skp n=2 Tax=Neolewinella agarilytica TaxID=478744 RepID=A0A1H9NIQ1_9BACT|nr:periplasmic chaperone for outer membrane proteins Skp [Neolewinella agarilytica]
MPFMSRILTSLLLVSVFALFLGCQQQEAGGTTAGAAGADAGAMKGPSIVFVRLDSLQTGYTELATELTRLEANFLKAQENHQGRVSSLQKEVQRLQNKVQQGLMTPNQIQSEQQRIGRKEQEIMQQRDIALASIQDDQVKLQAQFGERVKEILEDIQEEKGYDYILNEGGGSAVLVANDSYDITDVVLERLNASASVTMEKDSVQ